MNSSRSVETGLERIASSLTKDPVIAQAFGEFPSHLSEFVQGQRTFQHRVLHAASKGIPDKRFETPKLWRQARYISEGWITRDDVLYSVHWPSSSRGQFVLEGEDDYLDLKQLQDATSHLLKYLTRQQEQPRDGLGRRSKQSALIQTLEENRSGERVNLLNRYLYLSLEAIAPGYPGFDRPGEIANDFVHYLKAYFVINNPGEGFTRDSSLEGYRDQGGYFHKDLPPNLSKIASATRERLLAINLKMDNYQIGIASSSRH